MMRACLLLGMLMAGAGCAAGDTSADAPVPADATPPADSPAAAPADSPASAPVAVRDTVMLYKTATCGCCRLWGDHMRGEGFVVVARDVTDLQAVKDSLGVPPQAGSCHTATVGGYVVEGHVPAAQVRQLLRDRPDARGLAVPGMPLGSPGMEQGDLREPYDVLLVGRDGTPSVYEHIPGFAPGHE